MRGPFICNFTTEALETQRVVCLRRLEWSLNDLFDCIQVLHNQTVTDTEHQLIQSHYLMALDVKQILQNITQEKQMNETDLDSESDTECQPTPIRQTLSERIDCNLNEIQNQSENMKRFINVLKSVSKYIFKSLGLSDLQLDSYLNFK